MNHPFSSDEAETRRWFVSFRCCCQNCQHKFSSIPTTFYHHVIKMVHSKTCKQSKVSLRKFLERKNSVSTVATEQSSVSTGENWSFPLEEDSNRRVRFATTSDGALQCEIKTFQKYTDPSLWWQEDETEDTRARCISFVESKRRTGKRFRNVTVDFIEEGWKLEQEQSKLMSIVRESPACRGLELHLVPECAAMIGELRQSVLDVQQSSMAEPTLIRLASRAHSQGFVALALLRAQYDAEEAARSHRTPWCLEDVTLSVD